MSDSKVAVDKIVLRHYETLRDSKGHVRTLDYVLMLGVPVSLGVASGVLHLRIATMASVTAGLAILTALLFALVVHVFQLRMQVTNDPRLGQSRQLPTRIDELFFNVLYAVLVSLVTTVVCLTVDAATKTDNSVNWGATAVLMVLGSHLVLTIGMCMKRVYNAYMRLR